MDYFISACISCNKPLKSSDEKCDECHHVQIEVENLDEKIFLLYLKYLYDLNLSLESIKHDKLSGNTNYEFDLPLEYLDKLEGGTLQNFISKKYPELSKVNFIGLGYMKSAPSKVEQDIETTKKHLLQPIVSKIKDAYALMEKVELENDLLSNYILLKKSFQNNSASIRLYYAFKHVSSSEFRFQFEGHLKTSQLNIEALAPSSSRYEVLYVLREHAFSTEVRDMASFIYDLELCRGSRGRYQRFENAAPDPNSVYNLRTFKNQVYNEHLVQLISYKTYFPTLNGDTTKIFRNNLNLKSIAESLRGLQGQDSELDPWIYLICEETFVSHSIVLDETVATEEFRVSMEVVLNEKLTPQQESVISKEEKYEQLFWLLPFEKVERNLKIIAENKLNPNQLHVFNDMTKGIQKELEFNKKISFSENAIAQLKHHFISEADPNKRLFKQFSSISSDITRQIIRMKDFTALLSATENERGEMILPIVHSDIKENDLKAAINSLWKRNNIHLSTALLEKLNTLGTPILKDFIRSGPFRISNIGEKIKLNIDNEVFEYIATKNKEDVLSISHINRFCKILCAFRDKNSENQKWLDTAIVSFADVKGFRAETYS